MLAAVTASAEHEQILRPLVAEALIAPVMDFEIALTVAARAAMVGEPQRFASPIPPGLRVEIALVVVLSNLPSHSSSNPSPN